MQDRTTHANLAHLVKRDWATIGGILLSPPPDPPPPPTLSPIEPISCLVAFSFRNCLIQNPCSHMADGCVQCKQELKHSHWG